MSDVELTKEERERLARLKGDYEMLQEWMYDVVQANGAPFTIENISQEERNAFISGVWRERERQEEKRCQWQFTLDEWEHRKWVSECGGEAPIYFFPLNDVPFTFCPDCGSRIETKES
jgi:hypothetical protein